MATRPASSLLNPETPDARAFALSLLPEGNHIKLKSPRRSVHRAVCTHDNIAWGTKPTNQAHEVRACRVDKLEPETRSSAGQTWAAADPLSGVRLSAQLGQPFCDAILFQNLDSGVVVMTQKTRDRLWEGQRGLV